MATGTAIQPVTSSMLAVDIQPIAVRVRSDHAALLLLSGYAVTTLAGPFAGRVADRLGAREVYLGGLLLTAIAAAAATLCTTLCWLIAARIVMAIGSAAPFPAAGALLRAHARAQRCAPATGLAVLSGASQSGAAIGPIAGGVLVEHGGWASIFWAAAPAAASAAALGAVILRGAALPDAPPAAPPNIGPAPPQPGPGTGLPRTVVSVLARHLAIWTSWYSMFFALPEWLMGGRGVTAAAAGAAIVPLTSSGLLATALTARLITRTRPERTVRLGSGLAVLGLLAPLLLNSQSSWWLVVCCAAALGVPGPLIDLGDQAILATACPPHRAGALAGLVRSAQHAGALIAAGLILLTAPTSTHGLHVLATVAISIAGLVLISALRPGRGRRRRIADVSARPTGESRSSIVRPSSPRRGRDTRG